MAEQRIVITIGEDGSLSARTEGIKGEMCLKEIQELIGNPDEVTHIKKTDEYTQSEKVKAQSVIKNQKR